MNKYQKIVSGIIFVLSTVLIIFLNIDHTGHEMKFEDSRLRVQIDYIDIKDIQNVELLDDVFIGSKIKGSSTFTYLRGSFELEDDTKGKVYVYNKSKPYIRITTKDKIVIYNDKDSNETKETYNKLLNICNISESSPTKKVVYTDDSVIKYTSKDKMNVFISIIPVTIILTCIGIYSLNKKTPMHFWAGSTVKAEEISDVKAYNKANGIMWISYGFSFLLIPLFSAIFGEVIIALIYIFGTLGIFILYNLIYKKYKVK